KLVILGLFIFIGGLGNALPVWAYNDSTTHRAITQEAIKLFEFYNPNQTFLEFEENLIIQGSEDEDEAPRWLNHFYDPVHNRGFKGGRSSKDWAQNPNAQASRPGNGVINGYFSDPNDHSWPRAIYEYTWGDKERALLSLGHVLHLVQDATVPDHTRDDAHAFKKTYEKYAERFTTKNFRLADDLAGRGQEPIRLDSLDEYFDNLAIFSNGNFFSDHTILDDYYNRPIVRNQEFLELSDKKSHTFGIGDLEGVKLMEIDKEIDFLEGKFKETYILDDIDNLVASDYWQHLSEKAVLGSAGVIELFFKEVAAEKESRRLFDLNKSYLERFLGRLAQGAKNTLAILSFWRTSPNNPQPTLVEDSSDGAEKLENSEQSVPEEKSQANKGTEINQVELARLMAEVQALQRQLAEYQTKLAIETGTNQENVLGEQEVKEIKEEDRRVHTSVSGFLGGSSGGSSADENLISDEDEVVIAAPNILSPVDFSAPFSTATIIFSGTTTPGLTVFCDFGHNNTTTSELDTGEWALEIIDLPQGTTTLNFFARDIENHISAPVAVEISVDSLPAVISFGIEECKNSFFDDHCVISPVEKLNISWQACKGEYISYKLQEVWEFWEEAGEEVDIKLATTASTSLMLDCDYPPYYPVGWRLVLTAENYDGEKIQSEPFEIWFDPWPLIINEIGWTGTAASSTDEWLELYNPLPFEVNLEDFWIVGLDDKPRIELSGLIGGQSFYLIERNDDLVISDLPADLVAGFGESPEAEGLPDDNLQLKLVKKVGETEVVFDQTPLFIPSYYWPKSSIERRLWRVSGELQSNWIEAVTSKQQNGLDRNGEKIGGTPKLENSSRIFSLI
ncbi:MAG TPA: hypothetical protein PL159_01340, partial [Candidatus Paceibacterota bacterium]|nr:hypothetical protein [Candidatus Paceibacterota bacterium]